MTTTYVRARRRTRTRLMQAAIACLLRDGFARLTVTAVAAEADVGRGTFYDYFDDVEDLLLAVGRQHFEALQADVHMMMTAYESPEREQRAWQAAFERTAQIRPLLTVLNHPKAAGLAERFQKVMIEGFMQSLATDSFLYPQWMKLPHEVMATFSAGAVLALIRAWLAGDLAYSAEEMARMVYQLLYHQPPTAFLQANRLRAAEEAHNGNDDDGADHRGQNVANAETRLDGLDTGDKGQDKPTHETAD